MRTHRLVIATLATFATLADAQLPSERRPELRPFAGAFLPTGAQHDDFRNAATLGIQGAMELSSWMHLVATVGWTPSSNRFRVLDDDRTDIWQYDVGAEFNVLQPLPSRWLLRPFAGLGAGARTYDYRAARVGSRTCAAGYGSAGTELQRDYWAFRLEGRDYLSCMESPITGVKRTRNDVGVVFGVAYHLH